MPGNNQTTTKSNEQQQQTNKQQGNNQGVPLNSEQQNQAQAIEQQIQDFEQQLAKKSNSELSEIATKLETVERAMLLEKIDNQLHTVKNAVIEPGGAAPAAAATGATAAAVIANNS